VLFRNYAPTLQASTRVASEGHQQALWLLGDQVIEVGASNIFFIFKDKSGDIEIATPELEDLILPGVTRDSILVHPFLLRNCCVMKRSIKLRKER
jgi:branched-chain amino acid aminotransferase